MNFLFLMDPLETVVMEKDTSFILMLASYRRGHNVYFLSDGGILHHQGQTAFDVKKVVPQAVSRQPFIVSAKEILAEDQVDAIFVRSDPPFDGQYLLNTWLLDLLPKKIFVHGYLTSDGQKMSKSLGNVVDPFELVKKYGREVIHFWRTKIHQEIDFIVEYEMGKILPIEVKTNFQKFNVRTMKSFCNKYKIKDWKIIGLEGMKEIKNDIYPWEI